MGVYHLQSSTANMSTPQVSDGSMRGWGASRSMASAQQCKTHARAAEMVQGLASRQGCRGMAVPSSRAMGLGNERAHSIPAAQPGLQVPMKEDARGTRAHEHHHEAGTASTTMALRTDGGRRPRPGRRRLHGRKTTENLEDRGSEHTGGALTGPERAKSAQGAPSGFSAAKRLLDPGASSR